MPQVNKKFYMVLLIQMFYLDFFGIDRFYVNKNGQGLIILGCTLSLILSLISAIVTFITRISCIVATLTNKTEDVFFLGGVKFDKPTWFDKCIAVLNILFMLLPLIGVIASITVTVS